MSLAIFPSLLAADGLYLGETLEKLLVAGIDTIHLDIMDNHYVPNLSFSSQLCQRIHQKFPKFKLDVHLMVESADELIHPFVKAGAYRISIHPETTRHLHRSLELIKTFGCQAGIVLNPTDSLDILSWCHYLLDFVLVMTVNPGYGGQSFIMEILQKISALRKSYPELNITVDGGITLDNINLVAKAGANNFIVGTAFFSHSNYKKALIAFEKRLID